MSKIAQFFKQRYITEGQAQPSTDLVQEDYEHSDFGRTFGWWVLLDGQRVASLEYRCFLEEPVHLYEVHALHPSFSKIEQNPAKWSSPHVVLESRYAEDFLKKGLQMAPVGKGMIVVENLYVPEPYFKKQHDRITKFQDELLENATKSQKRMIDQEQTKQPDPAIEKEDSELAEANTNKDSDDRIIG